MYQNNVRYFCQPETTFDNLPPGSTFLYQKKPFIKVREGRNTRCASLEDGEVLDIGDVRVMVLSEVVIRPEKTTSFL